MSGNQRFYLLNIVWMQILTCSVLLAHTNAWASPLKTSALPLSNFQSDLRNSNQTSFIPQSLSSIQRIRPRSEPFYQKKNVRLNLVDFQQQFGNPSRGVSNLNDASSTILLFPNMTKLFGLFKRDKRPNLSAKYNARRLHFARGDIRPSHIKSSKPILPYNQIKATKPVLHGKRNVRVTRKIKPPKTSATTKALKKPFSTPVSIVFKGQVFKSTSKAYWVRDIRPPLNRRWLSSLGRFFGKVFPYVTGCGAVCLGYTSLYNLATASSPEQKLDATYNMACSIEGIIGSTAQLQAVPQWVPNIMNSIGTVGGLIQTATGAYRIFSGIKHKDKSRSILGAIDVGAGLCWIGTACSVATPYAIAGYTALSLGRIAYCRRDALMKFASKSTDRLKKFVSVHSEL